MALSCDHTMDDISCASDSEVLNSDLYDDEGDYNNYDDDSENYYSDSDDSMLCGKEQNYTILKEGDIRQRQEDDIARVTAVLSVSRIEAAILLRYYGWSVGKVHEEWFANEGEVRKSLGLLDKAVDISPSCEANKLTCKICYDCHPCKEFNALSCGHPFCHECWSKYVIISIDDGPGCLMLRCPEPSCRVIVDQDVINLLVSDEYKEKYQRYILRSYVEVNKKIKWCPAPGCDRAVEFDSGSGSFDVLCDCSHGFCWNCTEEIHRPMNCEMVGKWMFKNSNEADNVNWILCYTKPCPKCKTPIQKNQGCMHITCRPPCRHEFCWLCLEDWKNHVQTGGFYACNTYDRAKQKGTIDEAETKKEMARSLLEKYTHYFERWSTNQSSMRKALEDLKQIQTVHLANLSDRYGTSKSLLKFIIDAWLQIVECRRVLKWTYAYGYYLPENENAKKNLFEHLQGQAEFSLERLHQCAEEELKPFLAAAEDSASSEEFHVFSTKLIDLTLVTKRYFDNLVRTIESDLGDVE